MATITLGTFYGYSNSDTKYGGYTVYADYSSSGTTVSNIKIRFEKISSGNEYTTNTLYIDSIYIHGETKSFSPSSKKMSYSSGGKTYPERSIGINVSGSKDSGGTSCRVEVYCHRSGQNANAQHLDAFITGLATPPTGVWCSASASDENYIVLNSGYSSDGGASVTYGQHQCHRQGEGWWDCGGTVGPFNPGETVYFRVGYGNAAGTTWSGECSAQTYYQPHCTELQDFIIGNEFSVYIYNPLGRYIDLYLISNNNGGVIGTYSGNHNGWLKGFSEPSKKWASIPNQRSGTYFVRVVRPDISQHDSGSKTYYIRGDEYPNFGDANIINVKNTKHLDIHDEYTFLSGHNQLKGYISPMSSNYSANPWHYSISNAGQDNQTKDYSSDNIEFIFDNITSNVINVTAVDRRELSSAGTYSVNLVNYILPGFNECLLPRQNGTDNYVILTLNGNYTNWQGEGFKKSNSIQSVRFRYKEEGTSEYTWYPIDLKDLLNYNSDGSWGINNYYIDAEFSNTKRYEIEFVVTDVLGIETWSKIYTIDTAQAIVWKDLKNRWVGIRKKPETDFDVAGTIMGSNIWVKPNDDNEHSLGITKGTESGSLYMYANKYGKGLYAFTKDGNGDSNPLIIDNYNNVMLIANHSVRIPKDGAPGKGLCNFDGTSIIRDHNNGNITVDATGETLFLGWSQTKKINCLNGKVDIRSDGEIFAGNLNAGLNRDGWVYCRGISGENNSPGSPLLHGISMGYPGKDSIDFHEYGGLFRFYRNQGSPVHLVTIDANNITFHQINRRALLTENVSWFRHMGANTYIEINCDGIGAYGINMWASDIRLKHDIKDTKITALDYVNKIEHKEFIYNSDVNGMITKIGYIADQLKEIDEQLVFEVGDDKIKQPNEKVIIPLLSKAIQELSEENNNLKEKIKKIEERLNNLENK